MPSPQLFGYIPFPLSGRLEILRDICEPATRQRPTLLDIILDKDFAFGDSLSPPKRCCRELRSRHEGCPKERLQQSGCSGNTAVSKSLEKPFQADFDTTNFNPDEISVRVSGRHLTVEAEHRESGEERKVYRRMVQTMTVPDWLDTDTLKSSLSNDGILRVQAPPRPEIKDIPIASANFDSAPAHPESSGQGEEGEQNSTSENQIPV